MGIFGIYSCLLFLLSGLQYGANQVFNIIVGVLLYLIILQLKKEDTKAILMGVIAVCMLNAFYMLLQQFNFDFIYHIRGPNNTILHDAKDLIGLVGLKAVMGMWMGMGLLASFLITPWLGLLFVLPIYLSKCSGALLGITLALPFYLFYTKRILFKIITPIIIIGSIGYVYFVDNPMGMMNTRPPMWKMVLRDVVYGVNLKNHGLQSSYLRNPFTGFGLDSFRLGPIIYCKVVDTDRTIRAIRIGNKAVDEQGRPFLFKSGHSVTPDGESLDIWDDPHNELVHLFYDMGLIGCVIVGFIMYYLFKRFKRSLKTPELIVVSSMLIVLIGSSMSQFPVHLGRIGFMLPILIGLFVINSSEE